jgi:hypothetical protein
VYGGTGKFQDDPHWRDLILFYEYFHGDNGAGLGASHQTDGPASSPEPCICLQRPLRNRFSRSASSRLTLEHARPASFKTCETGEAA